VSTRLGAFAAVFGVAAVSTYLLTFVTRRLAIRFGAVVLPDPGNPRRVHTRPLPTSGASLFLGFLAAMVVASQIPVFHSVFQGSSEPLAVVLAASVMFGVGMLDDLLEVSPPAKMAGIVLSGSVLSLLGVVMIFLRIPFLDVLVISPDLAPLVTVVWVAGMANALNLIDGLDGLAAGIVAIAAGAFFLYTVQIGPDNAGLLSDTSIGPMIAAIACGICVGFLPHNFHPARIQMGDSGALFLGLLMAAATLAVGGRTDQPFSGSTYFFYAPIFIPFFILGVPIFDTAFAIVRRTGKFSVADKGHLHHRLMSLGHGQRRSVAILWSWTAILSGLVLFPTYTNKGNAVIPFAVLALGVLLYTFFHPGIRRGADAVVEDVLSHPPAD
jgi:UDP-GlcNAc:undecaprenyl-phosphate GlcNAc-1-phosphate transferase